MLERRAFLSKDKGETATDPSPRTQCRWGGREPCPPGILRQTRQASRDGGVKLPRCSRAENTSPADLPDQIHGEIRTAEGKR